MTKEAKPVRIIPREKAVFSLDKNGNWRSDGEKFRNQRIINYFHALIKKDAPVKTLPFLSTALSKEMD